ncbi:hypothetical protein [Streptomyces canus]|uniref:hypothetical protein n=1 Tax=Streptomyces canus TaxID=58343 RepID=UPI00382A246C
MTGLPSAQWDTRITTLTALHEAQRETHLGKRRGHRPRAKGDGSTGRRPILTLADRVLATVLLYRHGLPQVAIAALFSVCPEPINRRLRDVRELPATAGHALDPAERQLVTLNDLFDLAREAGITITPEIKTASY